MDVLAEILTWSQDRPLWQRDALRRLVANGGLEDADIAALAEICKSAHGLAGQQDATPLAKEHLPQQGSRAGRVNVHSIFHKRGVNALADNQTLAFGSQLTIVYGDNAAGKSGYTRILKSACRARGAEPILGNVLSGTTPLTPVVSVKYTVGDGAPQEWTGDLSDESIARVSVFDRHSEAVYTTQKTDVAFRPFGLDLFDKLAKACGAVRAQLEREQRALGTSTIAALDLPEGTAAAKLVTQISSLTRPEAVVSLATLSEAEHQHLTLLEKQLADLQANDPVKAARELDLRAGRLRTLAQTLAALESALAEPAVDAVFAAREQVRTKQRQAEALRSQTFSSELLTGTGSQVWTDMWESAHRFSEAGAYPGEPFPVTHDAARCVLCQQALGAEAAARLNQFQAFVVSPAETDLRAARETYARLHKALADLVLTNSATDEALAELRLEDEALGAEAGTCLTVAGQRHVASVEALAGDAVRPVALPAMPSTGQKLDTLVAQLIERAQALRKNAGDAERKAIAAELQELHARQTLGKHRDAVLDEIERKKRIAAYGLCLEDTRTQTITMKSTAVTKVAVTQQLKKTFDDELKSLNFRHVEVALTEAGGESGSLFHRLVLTRAPGVELPKVVSEGESRCLSIAAFFAELSTADDPSAILFDDPVSSFDYKWRDSVARRLVEEAKKRQVIVFTHDIVFLLTMQQYADQQGVSRTDQHVRQLHLGAGICEAELPWVALPVKKRIGFLKNAWQEADKLYRQGQQTAYEKEAAYTYGLLREAWERGLEEVLLGGVVERYRAGVQTQQIEVIADITPEDCKQVDVAMTKCSKWLPGHDQAPAAKQDMPPPDELKADIDALESWVDRIRKRRK